MNNAATLKLPTNKKELRAEFNHCAECAISWGEPVWARNLLEIAVKRGYKAEEAKLKAFLA